MARDLLGDPDKGSELGRMIGCVDRELRMRAQVYPRWVKQGKLTQVKADEELRLMAQVRSELIRGAALEEYVGTLARDDAALRDVARLEQHYARVYPQPAVSS